jgi:hypothetical protein
MSNFYELQGSKKDWTLAEDEKMFDKMKDFQDNIVGSAHLIHNSMNELNRAITASQTTLNNSINAFKALNFNKFFEIAVEETHAGEFDESSDEEEVGTMFGDLNAPKGPSEKMAAAIKIAIDEINNKEAKDDDAEDTKTDVKNKGKKLGISKKLKLPFVIGTKEFLKHPYAGLKYMALDDSIEMADEFKKEMDQAAEDQEAEKKKLLEN